MKFPWETQDYSFHLLCWLFLSFNVNCCPHYHHFASVPFGCDQGVHSFDLCRPIFTWWITSLGNASNNGSIFDLHGFGERTIQFPYKYAMETHGNTVEIDCLKLYHSV